MKRLRDLFKFRSKSKEHPYKKKSNKISSVQRDPKTSDHERIMSVYHLIVLDESGSMSCVRGQTISGCNETLQTIEQMQRTNPDTQRHYVSIYAFDTDNSRYIINDQPIDDVPLLTDQDYSPYGGTPLYDALGKTLGEFDATLNKGSGIGYVTTITDGEENSSREYSLTQIQQLIQMLKEKGVVFSFIGANIDAEAYARSMHIDNAMQFTQDEQGTREMWERERMSKMRSNARMEFERRYEREAFEHFAENENIGQYYSSVATDRITPAHITSLQPGEIFVFGSNIRGQHNGGAAGFALKRFGAVIGQNEGLQGRSYAIPTTGIGEEELYRAIVRFTTFAQSHPELTFLVTPIGCGNAGWQPYSIAPMFQRAARLPNVKLPQVFWTYCYD